MIERKNKPALYDLATSDKGAALQLSVHCDAVDFLQVVFNNSQTPFFADLMTWQERFNLPPFISPLNPNWGFGEILRKVDSSGNNQIVYECQLPKGSGRFTKEDQVAQNAVVATLVPLFEQLNYWDVVVDSNQHQLLEPDLIIRDDLYHSFSMNCRIGASLVPWLREQNQSLSGLRVLSKIARKMKSVHEHLTGIKDMDISRDYLARVRYEKYLLLKIPGQSNDLGPAGSIDEPDTQDSSHNDGYKLASHNFDTAVPQLVILFGLAMINEEARKAGY